MHPIAHGYSSVKFQGFRKNSDVQDHLYPLRNNDDFFIPRANSAKVAKMPLSDFPCTWNTIDDALKSTLSFKAFKENLKSHLMDKYYNFRCDRTICISCMNF